MKTLVNASLEGKKDIAQNIKEASRVPPLPLFREKPVLCNANLATITVT